MRFLFALLALFASPAFAQQISVAPQQVGIACAYNSALPTIVTANYGLVQCDSSGRLLLGASTAIIGNVGVAQGSTTSGQYGPLAQGAVTTSAPAYTTAQTSPISLTLAGDLRTSAGGYDVIVPVTPTVANSAHTYTSATNTVAVGGLQTVALFRTTTNPAGLLSYIGIVSKAGPVPTAGFTIYAWNKNPASSTCTDAAQFVHNAADSPYLIPGFPVTAVPAAGIGSATPLVSTNAFVPPISIKNADTSPTANIYVCVVGNTTFTPAANDFVFNYAAIQD